MLPIYLSLTLALNASLHIHKPLLPQHLLPFKLIRSNIAVFSNRIFQKVDIIAKLYRLINIIPICYEYRVWLLCGVAHFEEQLFKSD